MAAVPRLQCRSTLLCSLVLALFFSALAANGQQLTPAQIKALPECSLAKTNNSCKLIIDRSNPVAPSVVQMYSNQALTVVVKNPKPYEWYFLDYQTGQATLTPDVASSIVQGLLPSFAKAGEFHVRVIEHPEIDPCASLSKQGLPATPVTVPSGCDIAKFVEGYENDLVSFAKKADGIYRDLEPFVSPDSHLPTPSNDARKDLDTIQKEIEKLLPDEFRLSGDITVISTNLKALSPVNAQEPTAKEKAQELTAYQSIADAVAKDLLGYSQRIKDLEPFEPQDFIAITSNKDDEKVYHGMVTRTITYALNALNLVANSQEAVPDPTKKKLLASIAINFADSPSRPSALRWEPSAGVFFSSLPVRSFSVAPVFTSGAITNNIIAQNVLHPTVVPFAAANYRLSNDLPWTRWKSAIYWTGAVGINPNTVSADFASGLSISWRDLIFSPLWHYGHDVRLTQGLYVGESLGASFKGSLATQTYWTSSFALGVSIRVPSLTGR